MKKFFLLLAFGILASCSTKVTPPIAVPTPPPIAASAKPSLEKTQRGIDKSVVENTKIQSKVDEQKQTVLDQKIAITEALTQAEKIKEKAAAKQAITEIEAVDLINVLKKAEDQNADLQKQARELQETVDIQASLLSAAQLDGRDAFGKVVAKEDEATTLRDQNTDVGKSLVKKNEEVSDLYKDKVKDAKKLGSASVYKHWIIGGVILALLATVVTWGVKAGWFVVKSQTPL